MIFKNRTGIIGSGCGQLREIYRQAAMHNVTTILNCGFIETVPRLDDFGWYPESYKYPNAHVVDEQTDLLDHGYPIKTYSLGWECSTVGLSLPSEEPQQRGYNFCSMGNCSLTEIETGVGLLNTAFYVDSENCADKLIDLCRGVAIDVLIIDESPRLSVADGECSFVSDKFNNVIKCVTPKLVISGQLSLSHEKIYESYFVNVPAYNLVILEDIWERYCV